LEALISTADAAQGSGLWRAIGSKVVIIPVHLLGRAYFLLPSRRCDRL